MNTMDPGSSALRRGRRSIAGQPYLITVSTDERKRWFADPACADHAAGVLNDHRTWPEATVLAWVLMPDHLHLMLILGESETLPQTMARAKARIWHPLRQASGSSLRLWQHSYHDHALRRDEDLLLAGRYLLDNPVRAGLVECWSDWKWRGGSLLAAIESEWP